MYKTCFAGDSTPRTRKRDNMKYKSKVTTLQSTAIAITLLLTILLLPSTTRGESHVTTVTATFTAINAFEGSVALIFTDTKGKKLWFSHFAVDIKPLKFYTIKREPGAVIPQYRINPKNKGKKYRITFRKEKRENEYSGMAHTVMVIIKIREL